MTENGHDWQITIDKKRHSVALKYSADTRKPEVWVNGGRVEARRQRATMSTITEYHFQIGKTPLFVRIQRGLFGAARYDLVVDGISEQTGEKLLPMVQSRVPGWAWGLIGACLVILILAAGDVVIGGIGLFGAYLVMNLSRDMGRPERQRMVIGSGITVVCWVAFILLRVMAGG